MSGSVRTGQRGGHQPALSLSDVQQIFATWRSREYGWVRAHILLQAAEAGEFHADDCADWDLAQPNVIGAAVNALAKAGLLEKLNRHGEPEHRRGSSAAAHGRASYVWRATERGKQVARRLWHQRQAGEGFFEGVGVGAGLRSGPGNAGLPGNNRGTSADSDAQPTLFSEAA